MPEGAKRIDLVADVGELEPVMIEAADGASTDRPSLKKFAMVAYTGGSMDVGWGAPVVVDLNGMKVTSKARPILHQHDPARIVGHTDSVEVKVLHDRAELRVSGVISGASDSARLVLESAANGFPWQASIGARVTKSEFVAEGQTATVNGRNVSGPVYVARRSTLGEVSFVALGADDNTSAKVSAAEAAEGVQKMSEMQNEPTAPAAPAVDTGAVVAQIRAEAARESERISSIRKVCAGNGEIEAKAIAEGWDMNKTELEVLRASRPVMGAPAAHVKSNDVTSDVLAAAVCKAGRLNNVEAQFGEQTLEAADRAFRRGIGLQELLLEAAQANGYHGRSVKADTRGVLQAAFSNMALPGILSTVANKFLLSGFTAVEQAWRNIASIRSVSDFKTVTSYRLNGAFQYDEVASNGELKHDTVSESSFTNQAKTYGKMFAVTRQDIINDDLGALTALPTRIGRGGALKLNDVFWTAFMNNSSFFAAGNNNYAAGTTTAFGIDSLTAAEQKFFEQTDVDGKPLAIAPRILLVPPALNALAAQTMRATEIRDTTTSTKIPTANPHAGKFNVVMSAYLSNSAYTGNSSKKWYLLADPMDLSAIEVAFLNGVETPTVESADADFNVLGIQMRGYFDFGVAKQEPRAGVAMKGEA